MKTRQTSLDAYASVNYGDYPLKDRVLLCLWASEGMICEEVEGKLSARHQSASACLNNLVKKGWVEDSGDRRPTSSGRDAMVWNITFDGEDYLYNWVLDI